MVLIVAEILDEHEHEHEHERNSFTDICIYNTVSPQHNQMQIRSLFIRTG